jgi:hypothetical protein
MDPKSGLPVDRILHPLCRNRSYRRCYYALNNDCNSLLGFNIE